jgi:hypothetical protein
MLMDKGKMSMAKRFNRALGLGLLIAGISLLGGCGQAATPTFEAEAKGNTITVYSTANKADKCNVQTMFSYLQDGVRKTAGNYCNGCDIAVGKHVKLTEISDAIVIEPRIEGVKATCDSDKAAQPGPK